MTLVLESNAARPRSKRTKRPGLWLMLPAAAAMLLAFGAPLIFSAWYSFTGWSLVRPASKSEFVGLSNYTRVLTDHEYWQAIGVTLTYAASAVTIECILGIALALLLNKQMFGRGIFRSLMLIPMVMTPAVVGLFWKLFFEESDGLFNYFLTAAGLPALPWLGVSMALISIVILDVWQATPFFMLIMLAGLQSMDRNIVEAAEIDGASRLQVFRYITLPHLVPYIMVAAAFRIIGALADFDKIYLLTFGGPGNVTTTVSLYAYNRGFKIFDIGQTTAISWLFIILVLTITAPLIWHLLRGSSTARH
ncbi:ABC transporter permease subunit [Sinorhizobium meliloti]|nr:ABC transporter permease subunit [Sinorhizobium meliloti]MDX0371546.1 ABC transporter permease subunit [Sinorhizobium meliloti]MDX0376365.1 ABC transporter permease subunit [Sinorhizobium meliloti]